MKNLNKIALISLNFKKYSSWNGVEDMSVEDFKKLDSLVKLLIIIKNLSDFKSPF